MSLIRGEPEPDGDQHARGQKIFPNEDNKLSYFYVVIPQKDQELSKDTSTLVSSTKELMNLMKRNPRARFQAACTPEEAMRKALDAENECCIKRNEETKKASKRKGRQSFSAVEASVGASTVSTPQTGDLLSTGKEISRNQNEKIFERLARNPRILFRDTELPTILQEGCKYNALHLAAKCNNHEVMRRVLDMISCIDFLRQIYPRQSEESLIPSLKNLIVSYLNTPDKMKHQTPLHFACDFNSVECVELLLAHPFCDTTLKNFEGQTALEVIGSRDQVVQDCGDEDCSDVDCHEEIESHEVNAIIKLFEERFIVPIWRDISVDGEVPVLGDVSFILDLGQEIPDPLLFGHFPNFSLFLLNPCKTELIPLNCRHSSGNWKIRAYAGPMSETKAKEFRSIMKRSRGSLFRGNAINNSPSLSFNTPSSSQAANHIMNCASPSSSLLELESSTNLQNHPSLLSSPFYSPTSSLNWSLRRGHSFLSPSPFKSRMDLRVKDVEKGLERIAFDYCKEMGISWSEYWPFLGAFCDLTSEKGINLLEAHLRTLEATKKEERRQQTMQNASLSDFSFLSEKLGKLSLSSSSSGIDSPLQNNFDADGLCTNPSCRMKSRFCNCSNVVPPIPFEFVDDDDDTSSSEKDSWVGGKISDNGDNSRQSQSQSTFFESFKTPRCFNVLSNPCSPDSFNSPTNEWRKDVDRKIEFTLEDNDEMYQTAPSSPVSTDDDDYDNFQDCKNICIFLNGEEQPGKVDHQVFFVLNDCHDKMNSTEHLCTFQWFNSMKTHVKPLGKRGREASLHGYTPTTRRRLFCDP